ncbi:MAG: hypothetical protein NC429_09540 [Lachnospiraceae bacterium]|nr:hypothetical protein [Lachnospiraceae bacterium]
MKKSRLFAPFLMLLAGAIASIVMYYFDYSTAQMLPRLLAVLLVFYLAGCFIQKKILGFVEQIEEEERRAGEVIAKEAQDGEGTETENEEAAGAEDVPLES